jgi:HK97 family phage major capsid protein
MDPEIKGLNEKRDALAKQLKDLGAKHASWTDADRTAWNTLETEYAANKTAIEARNAAIEKDREERASIDARMKELGTVPAVPVAAASPMPGSRRVDDQGRVTATMEVDDETFNIHFSDTKGAPRQTYKDRKKSVVNTLKKSGYRPWGEFSNFAEYVRAGLDGHTGAAFKDRVRKHYNAVAGMSEGIGADGGFTVMPEFSNKIFDRVYANDLFGRTDNYTVTGNNMTFLATAETSRATGSRRGGVQGYWMSEGGSITKSKPTLREKSTLKLVKLGAVVYLTEELISDGGTAMEQYVAKCVAEEFNFMIGDSLINGTGVGQPLGILNCPVARLRGEGNRTERRDDSAREHRQDGGPVLRPQQRQLGLAQEPGHQPATAVDDPRHRSRWPWSTCRPAECRSTVTRRCKAVRR